MRQRRYADSMTPGSENTERSLIRKPIGHRLKLRLFFVVGVSAWRHLLVLRFSVSLRRTVPVECAMPTR